MSGDRLLAIDCGTQSVRALLFDPRGELLARARVPLVPYVSPEPGWAEHDADDYWERTAEACRRLLAEPGVDPSSIAGLALTTQRSTIVNVDAAGQPLRPAIVWLDRRRTEGLPPIGGLRGLAFRLAGVAGTLARFQAEAEANWIRTRQPEVWAATHKLLLLSGFLTHRLTGRFIDSVACQVGYLPFDYRRLRWMAPGSWWWQLLPMDPALLPDLAPPGALLGHLTAGAATATGLPAGLPVVAAAADKACEVLGSGALEPHVGCLSYGTTATVNVTERRYVEPYRFLPPYPAAIPGAHALEIEIYRGYWMVSWFRGEFGLAEEQRAAALGVAPETLFDDLLQAAPPGSMGLVLQPYWSPGAHVPGPEAKGAIIGFGDVHTRAHLYRSILEGLGYALREGKEQLERRTRVPITELRVSGGGSQSDGALQLTADIFGLPAGRPHTFETSGLGAAIDLAVGLGLHPSFEAAVPAMTRLATTFEPDPAAQRLYDELYRRVYRRLYPLLRPLYEEIRDVTGYPAG